MKLLNRKATRQFILSMAEAKRPGMFTRVSASVMADYEARLRVWITDDIERHPSIGTTFRESCNGAIVNKRTS